ncbi:hypothetical protein ACG5V6_15935 [Streptomyces chitinivorans]|uniref:Secreted protein n=1 Tax=Streptomyces chitinivorans TaxID=1257027 RepID=A0ABW7HUX4_9ACTN|nr:hypothetical protein [Streptomyces chitinivorans]MDH2407750.1 hypothetical protein [Streptomyces chitinivorans]
MEFVIGLLAFLFVLFVVLGAIATVKTVRAVRRGVERTGQQVRRTVEETTLKARSAQPGPVGELARVRLELRGSLDSTRRALEAGARHDPSLSEAAGLLDRLDEHARQLDGELRLLMEREPDRGRIAARIPDARERAERIRASADSLRFAAQDRARRHDEDGLTALSEQIEIEAGALRHWTDPASEGASGAATLGTASGARPPGQNPKERQSPDAADAPGARAPQTPGIEGPKGGPQDRTADFGTDFTKEFGPDFGPDFGKGRPQSAS